MKKKFIIFTLCFTLIFSSLNYKRSYADGGTISLPILATVSSLAVASGISLTSDDDIYDIGRLFYDYVKKNNDLTLDLVNTVFYSNVVVLKNGLISVKSDFLDIVKSFFDYIVDNNGDSPALNSTSLGLPFIGGYMWGNDLLRKQVISLGVPFFPSVDSEFYVGDIKFVYSYTHSSGRGAFKFYIDDVYISNTYFTLDVPSYLGYYYSLNDYTYKAIVVQGTSVGHFSSLDKYILSSVSLPYVPGSYNWDNLESKKEEDKSIALPIPGDLGNLVGQGSTDFWDNTDGLVGGGDISIPNIDNPSIGLDDIITFPNVSNPDVPGVDDPSVPNDTPFDTITDYIIGLVVPSDTFWTDTWSGLYNNFVSSFPMVDMDGFNDLVTGEKKFPNIDINIMGVRGRVVNGDIVNSIVDWLRPIIAGFMMLCLMFFNYRKIYKLIRNSEPFEGIGKVENHAN